MTDELIIQQTQNWIKEVVIGCNFCPFAAKAMLKQNIRYTVLTSVNIQASLEHVAKEMLLLDDEPESETSFIIFANNFTSFSEYLLLVDKAEQLLSKTGYNGIYQLASFHPDYCFAGSDENDPANYTNRSIFPMLHFLREDSVTAALENFPSPEKIPQNNIYFAEQKGLLYMQMLRKGCIR